MVPRPLMSPISSGLPAILLAIACSFADPGFADASTKPDPAPAHDASTVDGIWRSDFGPMTLDQDGATVRGTYRCCGGVDGELAGRRVDDRLELTWSDPVYGRGTVVFEIRDDGAALAGTWWSDGPDDTRRPWNARRVTTSDDSAPVPRGTPTDWQVTGRQGAVGTLEGTATLYLDGDSIRGRLEGVYRARIVGETLRIPVVDELEGVVRGSTVELVWTNQADGSTGEMILEVRDNDAPSGDILGQRLDGSWRTLGAAAEDAGEISFERGASATP